LDKYNSSEVTEGIVQDIVNGLSKTALVHYGFVHYCQNSKDFKAIIPPVSVEYDVEKFGLACDEKECLHNMDNPFRYARFVENTVDEFSYYMARMMAELARKSKVYNGYNNKERLLNCFGTDEQSHHIVLYPVDDELKTYDLSSSKETVNELSERIERKEISQCTSATIYS
jgi:hypothetical protein